MACWQAPLIVCMIPASGTPGTLRSAQLRYHFPWKQGHQPTKHFSGAEPFSRLSTQRLHLPCSPADGCGSSLKTSRTLCKLSPLLTTQPCQCRSCSWWSVSSVCASGRLANMMQRRSLVFVSPTPLDYYCVLLMGKQGQEPGRSLSCSKVLPGAFHNNYFRRLLPRNWLFVYQWLHCRILLLIHFTRAEEEAPQVGCGQSESVKTYALLPSPVVAVRPSTESKSTGLTVRCTPAVRGLRCFESNK